MGRREEGQTDTTESNSVIAGQDLSVESSQGWVQGWNTEAKCNTIKRS
jgi:hypothetical protein